MPGRMLVRLLCGEVQPSYRQIRGRQVIDTDSTRVTTPIVMTISDVPNTH